MIDEVVIPKNKRFVIFDNDGPILDSPLIHLEEFDRLMVDVFGVASDKDRYFQLNGSDWLNTLREFGDVHQVEEFIHRFGQFMIKCQRTVEKFEDVDRCIWRLLKSGISLFVASAASHQTVLESTKRVGVFQYFKSVSGWDNFVDTKEDQIRYFAKKMQTDLHDFASQAMIIEDSIHGIEIADKLGVKPIPIVRYPDAPEIIEQLGPWADEAITSLDQIKLEPR